MSQRRPQPRVFVVDDEALIATSLSTILRHSGFDAIAYTQPREALKAAETDFPELLISDLIMPNLSGVELAIEIQKMHPNCKVLLCSGLSSDREQLSHAAALGHDFEHLVKPVHPKDLLKKIHQVTGTSPALPTVGELLAGL